MLDPLETGLVGTSSKETGKNELMVEMCSTEKCRELVTSGDWR